MSPSASMVRVTIVPRARMHGATLRSRAGRYTYRSWLPRVQVDVACTAVATGALAFCVAGSALRSAHPTPNATMRAGRNLRAATMTTLRDAGTAEWGDQV